MESQGALQKFDEIVHCDALISEARENKSTVIMWWCKDWQMEVSIQEIINYRHQNIIHVFIR